MIYYSDNIPIVQHYHHFIQPDSFPIINTPNDDWVVESPQLIITGRIIPLNNWLVTGVSSATCK